MTPAPKRGSRSRPSTIALEESAGRRHRKRTRSTNSLPLSSEPPSVLSTLNNRSRSLPRSNAQKLHDRRVDGPSEDPKVPILSDRMAPDAIAVETQPLSAGALENLNGPLRPSLSGTRRKHNGHASDRDSESSLSDIGEDSEAETERLHNSPLKQRPKFVQHRKDSTSTTQAIAIEMPARKEVLLDQGDVFADDAADDSTPSTPTQSSPNKKRKRDFQESPLVRPTEEPKARPSTPPKKKVHTPQVPSENGSVSTLEGKKPSSDDDEHPAIINGIRQETPAAIVTNSKDVRPVKSIVKVATPVVEESDSNPDQDQESERVAGIEIEENTDVTAPIVPEEEHGDTVDTTGVDDEDLERALKKKAAMEELAEIERVFAHLKDRIYSEKLRRVEIEMKMIQEGTHPEYVAQKACIDQKLDERVRLADAQYKNGMESLDIATRVTKAQVHSQYYQRVRELRENTLNKCSELWYHIQRERRAGDTLVSEYTYRIPDRASTRIQHRRQYNWEVALLTGISKHIGFPAAPDVLGASEEERAEDLEAIGIAPRVPVRASATVQPPVLRDRLLDDHYERPQPIHWSQVQRHSPPSPAPQPVQAHSHPHVHIHHHHNRRHAASGVSNQPDQPLFLKQRVPSATGSANPGNLQPPNVPLSALLQNDIKQEHSSPRPPPNLALSIHGGNNQNRSPQLAHNHPQSQPSQRPLQYNYSGHSLPSHPSQPPPPHHQHHSLYTRAGSIESHPAPPPAPQRIIDLGSPAPGERMYGREVEAPDGGLKRLKEENDGSIGVPPAPMRFSSRMF